MPGPPLLLAQPLTLATLAATLRGGEPPGPPAASPAAAGTASTQAAAWLLAHACGTGPEVPPELVRRLLLLKAHALSLTAAVNALVIKRLLDFYNRDVWPVIYEQGAPETPLAHLALPLLGLGEVNYQGYRLAAADVLGLFGWEPLGLSMPESQALLTGAEFTLAYATEALERAAPLLRAAAALAARSTSEPAPTPGPETLAEAARVVEAACNTPQPAAALPPVFGQLATVLAAVGQASARRVGSLLAASPAVESANFRSLAALPAVAASLAAASQRLAEGAGPAEVRRLLETTEQLLGLELLAAAQVPHERQAALGGPLPAVLAALREVVTFVVPGVGPAPGLHRAARFVREYEWA